MKRKFFELIIGVVAISVVALQPGFAQGTDAGQGKDQATKEQPAAASENAQPGYEGIKVHGHWTIEVRNPDGKLVTHREFENALVNSGSSLLGQLIGRAASAGFWNVYINGPCNGSFGPTCVIGEPASGNSGIDFFNTLSVKVSSASLSLSGTATAHITGSISSVSTGLSACPSSNAPSAPCSPTTEGYTDFTSATVSPAINVLAGQTIAVTVTISFS